MRVQRNAAERSKMQRNGTKRNRTEQNAAKHSSWTQPTDRDATEAIDIRISHGQDDANDCKRTEA